MASLAELSPEWANPALGGPPLHTVIPARQAISSSSRTPRAATQYNLREKEAPEARATVQAWTSQWVIDQFERLRDFQRTRMTLPEDWQNVAFRSSRHLRPTTNELAQLADQLNAVLQPWRELTKSRVESNEAPPDTRPIFVFYHAFPE
ncbi:hypothetical protein [Nonomuraea sp. NPDC049695]|uniref:hypothetical protein n=1 Tax=Nonomuraea sp. NPDC049695 TaxID=3154734 RepID=UPI00341C62B9